jgi:hypothetical protein
MNCWQRQCLKTTSLLAGWPGIMPALAGSTGKLGQRVPYLWCQFGCDGVGLKIYTGCHVCVTWGWEAQNGASLFWTGVMASMFVLHCCVTISLRCQGLCKLYGLQSSYKCCTAASSTAVGDFKTMIVLHVCVNVRHQQPCQGHKAAGSRPKMVGMSLCYEMCWLL